MPRLPKYNSQRLFHKLAREVKNDWIKREGRKPTRDEWNQIQKWTSKNLFQDYKGRSYRRVSVTEIEKDVQLLTRPRDEIPCGDVFSLNPSDYALTEWWDIPNVLDSLPPDVQVRVNGGSFGITEINQNRLISIDDYRDMFDNIREIENDESGQFEFEGFVKFVPNKKDDGKNCSYYIDFVLIVNGERVDKNEAFIDTGDQEIGFDRDDLRRKKEIARRKNRDKSERRKKSRTRERPKEKKKAKESDDVAKIKEFRKLREDGVISQSELMELLKEIARKEDGGEI